MNDDMAEVNHFTTSESKKPLKLDWDLLFDDPVDDRPPEIVVTSHEKSKGGGGDLQQPEMEVEDTEYQMKTDGELEVMIPRIKSRILTLGPKLKDNGEKLKATLRRCVAEVERRKRSRAYKGGTGCKETLLISDESDDDTFSGKKKSDQKSSSASPDFAKLFSQKMDQNENHPRRTVDAFQNEMPFFQGRKMKQNGGIQGKGGSMQQVSSRSKQFKCPTSLMGDNKKQRLTNAVKSVSHSPCRSFRNRPHSSPKAHVPQNQPSKKLKPKNVSTYHLVDEDPTTNAENFDDWPQASHNLLPKKVSAYCLEDEEFLAETFDDWSHASHSPPSRKSKPIHGRNMLALLKGSYVQLNEPSSYHLVDEEPPAEKLDDCMQNIIVYYPSRDDQDSVDVVYNDMACLAPQVYLSSTIMNFYIRYLLQTTSSKSIIGNFHFFNTYFYNKLQKLSYREEDSFLKFRKWWKGVNIFKKAYILLPIHDKAHWSLGIICIPSDEDELGPIVLHLDSLGLHDSKSILDNIKSFVKEEWKYLRNSEAPLDLPITDEIWENLDLRMDDRKVSVPQQRNEYDCGLFVLYYMERFIKEAPHRFKEEDLSMFSKKWFGPEEASGLRRRIHNLLVHEFKTAKEKETTTSSPNSSS